MRKFINCMLFSLLLVGWTVDAQAQRLPAESLPDRLSVPAFLPSNELDNVGHHAHGPVDLAAMGLKPSTATSKQRIQFTADVKESRPGSKVNAPLRAGADYNMKSISKEEADAITYMWDNGDGQGPRPSKATDVAKDPYQMYELLREVYTNKSFPGPYYSAFTKNDVRERKVYYGAIEGGWNIGGNTLPSTSTTETTTTSSSVIVANGTATNYNIPAQGYYQDYGYRDQMIYTASQLGLHSGDKITSLTFYPSAGIKFYGSTIKLSLGSTSNSSFSSTSMITSGLTQVATLRLTATNTSATEWTFTFDQPYTYNGGNLVVQVQCQGYRHDGTTGQYDSSSNRTYFYGQDQSANQSLYAYGSNSTSGQNNTTGTRSTFLPKTKFTYERTTTHDPYNTIGDIKIVPSSNDVFFRSITVYDESNNVLFSWNCNETVYTMQIGGNTYEYYNMPFMDIDEGYFFHYGYSYQGTTYHFGYIPSGSDPGTMYIPYFFFKGNNSVRLVINAMNAGDGSPTITVNGGTPKNITTQSLSGQNYEWTINARSFTHTEYDPDYYLPEEEGYTALVVAVKNEAEPYYENYDSGFENGYFDTKAEIIDYLATHVDSIKLLTDGMRVGKASDYTIGTMFNAEGTYNKFFFLGKGQARQKSDILRYREVYNNHLMGEEIPFRFMFEQFSPTSGESGAQTENFYSKMMEGNVYNVIHDCRSVMQFNHQFSMSGNNGATAYAMTGMNFFIPDYRLKYWEEEDQGYYFDGRIANNYQIVSDDGNPALDLSLIYRNPSGAAAWYAQYNQQYPPKVGLYKITLEAVAEPRTDIELTHDPDNENYMVTLTWVSSLNEMTGHEVAQTYTVYYYDENGVRQYLVVDGYTTVNGETGETTLVYYVPQRAHSYTIDHVVVGSPDDADHDQFVAESNIATVVIPGWEDFVGLQLDHHESDFDAGDMANYYRNFLTVVNEDIFNGLTVAKITGYNEEDPSSPLTPMNKFNLYRWAIKDGVNQPEEKVAVIEFNSAAADQVYYNIYYEDNDHGDLTAEEIAELTDQVIYDTPKYSRSTMNIPDNGWVRVKGNGDLVIWPNGYHVNFKSITIKNNGSVLQTWTAPNSKPSTWKLSPGSDWVNHTLTGSDDQVMYIEGGGYIYIPNMLNTYNNLSVEIVAYGDGANVTKIAVNDENKSIANGAAATYTWGTTQKPISPNAAPKRETTIETVTIGNGASVAQYFPIWGYYHDESQHTQMIYPASMLSAMNGKTIKSMTFYPAYGTASYNDGSTESASGINFTNGSVAFKMMNLSSGNSFNSNNPQFITGTMTLVKTVNMPNTENPNATTWVIEFDQDFTYTGGDLLIDVTNPTTGDWGLTFFAGDATNAAYSYISAGSGGSGTLTYLPQVTFTYETEGGETPPDPSLDPTDAGLLRLHMLMVDQFKEEIPDDNKHPKRYGYVLRYEPETGDHEESGSVYVNIEKTNAKPNGYYTKAQIDNDMNTDTTLLTMDVLTADVEMQLDNENPNILYFEMKGKKDAAPTLEDPYLTKLQYMKNIRMYEEMEESSPNRGRHYDPEEKHHYYDASTPISTGSYGINFMTYAPMVSTWGIDRRYYEDDGEDNTYGAPIWKTAVGRVEIQDKPVIQKQVINAGTSQEANNPHTTWTVGDKTYCLYFLGLNAQGTLPNPEITNIKYQPYMFRVFVSSPSGKLRKFDRALNPQGGGYEAVDAGTLGANEKYCVGSFSVNNGWHADDMFFSKSIASQTNRNGFRDDGGNDFDPNAWDGVMMFGAEDGIKGEDVQVFVRFYYMVEGWDATRDGDARPGNGSESQPGKPNDPSTFVYELIGNAEVVGVTYVNAQGMKSDKPFDGLNIIVTRYSDGTTSTTKVIK